MTFARLSLESFGIAKKVIIRRAVRYVFSEGSRHRHDTPSKDL